VGRVNRATIHLLLDAVETGDSGYVADVLLDELDNPTPDWRQLVPPVCEVCGQRAWPDDLAKHVYSAHNPPAWGRRAA
jgi:hypothetical protein